MFVDLVSPQNNSDRKKLLQYNINCHADHAVKVNEDSGFYQLQIESTMNSVGRLLETQ